MTTPIEQDDETARLRAEIERTRAQLGQSVDALVAKVDVPARVHAAATRRIEPVGRLARSATGGAVTLARTATGGVAGVAAAVTGVARDGIGIGVALTRWGAGSVTGAVRRLARGGRPAAGDVRPRG